MLYFRDEVNKLTGCNQSYRETDKALIDKILEHEAYLFHEAQIRELRNLQEFFANLNAIQITPSPNFEVDSVHN